MADNEYSYLNQMPVHRFIERHLIDLLVRQLRDLGWAPVRFEADGDEIKITTAAGGIEGISAQVWKAFTQYDEGHLFFKSEAPDERWVYLIGGNGEDVISDYYASPDWDGAFRRVFLS